MAFLFSVGTLGWPFCFCWAMVWMDNLSHSCVGEGSWKTVLEVGNLLEEYMRRGRFKWEEKQCALSVGRVMGMRCWLCWDHPQKGPGDFRKMAHKSIWDTDNWTQGSLVCVTANDQFVCNFWFNSPGCFQIVFKHSASSVLFYTDFFLLYCPSFSLFKLQVFDMSV